jgi:methylenetetrahydrofolate reductase (NADPH)
MSTRVRNPHVRTQPRPSLTEVLSKPRYEVLPLSGIEKTVAQNVPPAATVTVTASPRQGIDATVDLARRLAGQGWHAVPHLSARLIGEETELKNIIADLTDSGINEVFVIGGDPDTPAGDFSSSLELLQAMQRIGHEFEVGIAGYPEPHPKLTADVTVQAMWDKRIYATYIVSQMCFQAKPLLEWVRRVRARGVVLPLYVGIAGPVSKTKLLRTGTRIGVGQSLRLLKQHGPKLLNLTKPARWQADKMLKDLAPAFADPSYGLEGIHINTFNSVHATEKWRQQALSDLS